MFLFEEKKETSFSQQPPLGSSSGILLCRHIYSSSSEPENSVEAIEELSIKIDAFGDVFPENFVEAIEE